MKTFTNEVDVPWYGANKGIFRKSFKIFSQEPAIEIIFLV
jgi:hypothetical protein